MLTKANFPLLNAAYWCSTNARLAHPHPSPIDIYQIAKKLEKSNPTSIFQKKLYAQEPILDMHSSMGTLFSSLKGISGSPWCNGMFGNIYLHPLLVKCLQAAEYHGLTSPQLSKVSPAQISQFLDQFQSELQTRNFDELKRDWDQNFLDSESEFNNCIRKIKRSSSGFEMHEFVITSYSSLISTPQIKRTIDAVVQGFIENIIQDQILAILLKKELSFNNQVKLRFIVLLARNYIDDPQGFSDFSFFEKLKYNLERSEGCTIHYDPSRFNGYLASNLFHYKSIGFQEEFKQLRSYLIGTDTVFRIASTQATFSVLYIRE